MSMSARWIAVLTALMLVLCSMSMVVGADGSSEPEVQQTEAVASDSRWKSTQSQRC